MFNRINGVIAREKLKHPGTPGFILLLRKTGQVAKRKVNKLYADFRIRLTKDSTFTGEHEMAQCSLYPKKVLDIILQDIRPASVLDVGCGTGTSLHYFIEKGVDAWGVENSELAIKRSQDPEKIVKHNLNKELNLNKKFDLVWCFEVIEHIHPDFEDNMLKTLTNHSNTIVLSGATPGQGGTGHFNEQPEQYWIDRFEKLGYKFDRVLSQRLKDSGEEYADNLMCYRK